MVEGTKFGGIADVHETRASEAAGLVKPAAKGIYSPFIFLLCSNRHQHLELCLITGASSTSIVSLKVFVFTYSAGTTRERSA